MWITAGVTRGKLNTREISPEAGWIIVGVIQPLRGWTIFCINPVGYTHGYLYLATSWQVFFRLTEQGQSFFVNKY